MAITNKSSNNRCWPGFGKRETLFHCLWECKLVQLLWKAVQRYLKKLNMNLLFDPAIPLLEIYLKEPKTLSQKNISTHMFIAVLFIITKIWKKPKCPQVGEWIKQLWAIHIMEYYSVVKKKKKEEENFTPCDSMDEPGGHYDKWNKPVRERHMPCDFTHIWTLKKNLNKQNRDRLIGREHDDGIGEGGA